MIYLQNQDINRYIDIILFIICWSLLTISSSIGIYHYQVSIIQKQLDNQLIEAKNNLETSLVLDFNRIEVYLDELLKHIHQNHKVVKNLDNLSQKIDVKYISNFRVELVNDIELATLKRNNEKYSHIIAFKGDNKLKKGIVVKVDASEFVQKVNRLINNDNIGYSVSFGKEEVSYPVDSIVPYYTTQLSALTNIVLYYKPGYLSQCIHDLQQMALRLSILVFCSGNILFFISRVMLSKFLLKSYCKLIDELKTEIKNAKLQRDIIQTNLDRVQTYIGAMKYENYLVKVFKDSVEKIHRLVTMLANKNSDNIIPFVSKDMQDQILNEIITQSSILYSGMIIDKSESIIDIKALVYSVIDLLSIKALEKEVEIEPNINIAEIEVILGENALRQILYSILHYQISALSKGKRIMISCFQDKSCLNIKLIDNGFGFELENLQSYLGTPVSNMLMLSWPNIQTSLERHNISFIYTNEAGSQFLLIIPLVSKSNNTKRKNNVYRLQNK